MKQSFGSQDFKPMSVRRVPSAGLPGSAQVPSHRKQRFAVPFYPISPGSTQMNKAQ
ncbi:MAG: hypothetical protein RIC33_10560 [Gimesia maris]